MLEIDKCFGKRNGICVCQSWTEHQEKGAWGMQYAGKEATEIKYSSQLCTNWIVFISQWVNQVWVYLAWYFLSAGCNQLLSSFLHGWSRCLHGARFICVTKISIWYIIVISYRRYKIFLISLVWVWCGHVQSSYQTKIHTRFSSGTLKGCNYFVWPNMTVGWSLTRWLHWLPDITY